MEMSGPASRPDILPLDPGISSFSTAKIYLHAMREESVCRALKGLVAVRRSCSRPGCSLRFNFRVSSAASVSGPLIVLVRSVLLGRSAEQLSGEVGTFLAGVRAA
jgi:hypothetical protein